MNKRLSLLLLAVLGVLLFGAGPAWAQATRTWVSGVGDDANPCSRTAPCKTFAGAISKTSASGEINVLDPGGFGALTITKAITVSADGVIGGVLVAGTNGIVIAAGASDVVVLRGLVIDGLGPTGGSTAGVNFVSGAQLTIDHCQIFGFQGASGAGSGINFIPSANAQLTVLNSTISYNGSTGGTFGGSGNILVQPQSTGNITALFDNVEVLGGFKAGVRFDGTVGTGTVMATIKNSSFLGNPSAIISSTLATGGGVLNVMVQNSNVANSSGFGIHSEGVNSTVRVTGTTVTQNGTGLASLNSGVLASFGNNSIGGNTTDGAFTTTGTLK